MSTSPDGYFTAYINSRAYRPGPTEKLLMQQVTDLARQVLPGSQVHWAGSQRKATAIDSSDLDLCLASPRPTTEAQRRQLRGELEAGLGRPARVLSHVIRLPAQGAHRKVDLAFANAGFGARPLPDPAPFHNQPARQAAARALKLWTRSGGLPPVAGWAWEGIVIHLDQPSGQRSGLALFQRVVGWLQNTATPPVIEAVLRPLAFPRWNSDWGKTLPGTLTALGNHARALSKRSPSPETWQNPADVGRWLGE